MEGVSLEDYPLEKRFFIEFDMDHTLSVDAMQKPLLEDNLDSIIKAYDGRHFREVVRDARTGAEVVREGTYHIASWEDWFQICNSFATRYNTVGYIDQFLHDNRTGVFPHYSKKDLQAFGTRVVLAPGIPEFFQTLREKWKGEIYLSFNLISTGMRDIIDGMLIAKEFDNIFACELRERNGAVDSVTEIVQPFTKSRSLIWLSKGGDEKVDDKMPRAVRKAPYENMICVGDGMSDVPHFARIKKEGGYSICVYPENNAAAYGRALENKTIMARTSLLAPRTYEIGSPIWAAINYRIEKILGRQCDFDKRIIDICAGGDSKPKIIAGIVKKHLSKCAECKEDLQFMSVPPGKSLVMEGGRLAVV